MAFSVFENARHLESSINHIFGFRFSICFNCISVYLSLLSYIFWYYSFNTGLQYFKFATHLLIRQILNVAFSTTYHIHVRDITRLLPTIQRRKLQYFGYVIQSEIRVSNVGMKSRREDKQGNGGENGQMISKTGQEEQWRSDHGWRQTGSSGECWCIKWSPTVSSDDWSKQASKEISV